MNLCLAIPLEVFASTVIPGWSWWSGALEVFLEAGWVGDVSWARGSVGIQVIVPLK